VATNVLKLVKTIILHNNALEARYPVDASRTLPNTSIITQYLT